MPDLPVWGVNTQNDFAGVMTSYVIIHNMIVGNEGVRVNHVWSGIWATGDPIGLPKQNPATISEFTQMHQHIRHGATHEQLQNDSV